jgi:hypothetical protein
MATVKGSCLHLPTRCAGKCGAKTYWTRRREGLRERATMTRRMARVKPGRYRVAAIHIALLADSSRAKSAV